MTSEELLTVLQELAKNTGDVLYDWTLSDVEELHLIARKLIDTTRNVIADRIALEEAEEEHQQ